MKKEERLLELYKEAINLKNYVIQLIDLGRDYQHIQEKIREIFQEINKLEKGEKK